MKFAEWASMEVGLSTEQIDVMHLVNAFEVLVCRCDSAAHRGAPVPLITISPKRAGGNSRAVTRSMLARLGYTRPQLRVIHRLLAGSTGGWPGLLTLFTSGQQIQPWHRRYVRHQVRLFVDKQAEVITLCPTTETRGSSDPHAKTQRAPQRERSPDGSCGTTKRISQV